MGFLRRRGILILLLLLLCIVSLKLKGQLVLSFLPLIP